MTDTQRTDMLACYGGPLATPNLDRLAAEGIRFDRAYTTQPVCGPARSALFTGYYPHSNGSWGNSMSLQEHARTIGSRLQAAGIVAGYTGKWHLDGFDYFGEGVCPDRWEPESWYDMRNYLDELSPEDRVRSRNPRTNDEGIPADFTFGHRVTNRAIDFLDRHRGDDFFLTVSYDEPHQPFLCPEPYASMYRDFVFPSSPNVTDTLEGKPTHQHAWAGEAKYRERGAIEIRRPDFFGCNSFVDSEIGRVLEAAERLAPDALVIYTSDHGDMLESHCLDGKGPVAYEEITHIPLIVRGPEQPSGTTSRGLVSHIDMVPTLLTHFGVDVPSMLEGVPLQPQLIDPATTIHDTVFLEFGRYEIDHDGFGGFQPMRCAIDDSHKLVVNLLSEDELYHLDEDPQEMHNLIDHPDHAAVRDRLHDEILAWMNDTRDPFRGYYWERRPWRTDARPATWDYTLMTRQRTDEDRPRQLDYGTGLEMERAVRKK